MLSKEAMEQIEGMRGLQKARLVSSLEEMRKRQKTLDEIRIKEEQPEILRINGIEVDRIVLPGSDAENALIYIHGGGFKNGFASNGFWLSKKIASMTGQAIYGINYRLAPEFTYPTAFMDVVDVWKSLLRSGINPNKSTFIGTSAGGSLCLSASLWCRDHGIPLPSSIVVNSPFVGEGIEPDEYSIREDVILNYPEHINEYFSTADSDDPCAYPILGDYFGFPPISIYAARREILYKHSLLLSERLEEQGIPHSYHEDAELWHAFLNARIPENIKYIEEIASFINSNKR